MSDGRVNNGGKREGSGRKRRPAFVDDGKLLPLALMLQVMRDEDAAMSMRLAEAHAAAPYCHARLQNTQLDIDADLNITLVSYLDDDKTAEPDAA